MFFTIISKTKWQTTSQLIKDPPDNIPISNFIVFLDSSTHSSSQAKIQSTLPPPKSTSSNHFYFNRIVRIWNSLSYIDLDSPFLSIESKSIIYLSLLTRKFVLPSIKFVCVLTIDSHEPRKVPFSLLKSL